jgi:hypothetical protein
VADECGREKRSHDRAKRARDRAWDRYVNKQEEAARHLAEAALERATMGLCIDIRGAPVPQCVVDHILGAMHEEQEAEAALEEASSYFDEWLDAIEEEEEREDEYCECLNRQDTG